MLFCLITRTHAIASCETRTSPSVRARSLCIRRILSKSAEALSRPSRSPLLLPRTPQTHGRQANHLCFTCSAFIRVVSWTRYRTLCFAIINGTLGRSAPDYSPYLRRFVERCPAQAPFSTFVRDDSEYYYSMSSGALSVQAPTKSSCFGRRARPDSNMADRTNADVMPMVLRPEGIAGLCGAIDRCGL